MEHLLESAAAALAVPAFLFVDTFMLVLPVALGFAAGAMVWMVLGELVPEALETASAKVVALAGGTALLSCSASSSCCRSSPPALPREAFGTRRSMIPDISPDERVGAHRLLGGRARTCFIPGAMDFRPAIVVSDLRVSRGGALVLPGLSLTVAAGIVTGLLGPSGSARPR